MIIYIHGFGGSGQGSKAGIIKEHFKEKGVLAPSLSYVPELAMSTLIEMIETVQQKEQTTLVGSSLGGYYTLYLAERFKLKAVLINPAIRPYETLRRAIGNGVTFYDNSQYEWNETHLDMLETYDVKELHNQTDLMLMVQKGDELLDYKEAVAKVPNARIIMEEGGSHQFNGLENHLKDIEDFFHCKK